MSTTAPARIVEVVECVVSVLLAIAVAHLIGATHVSWAAYAGYMVLRGHFADTLSRGLLRIVGTVVGAFLALGIAPVVLKQVPLAALALLIVGTGSLYAALTARRAYAWLFYGLTFAMVLLDKIERPGIPLAAFVQTRILETVAGTAACVAVSLLSVLTLRRRWPAPRSPATEPVRWHPYAFQLAVQGGAALVILTILGPWLHLPALAQSAITIMAVMLVPLGGAGGYVPVRQRLIHRFVGCIAGAALAALCLLVAEGFAPLLIFGTVIGVAIGRYLEIGDPAHRYVGMQFALSILVILVPDDYAAATMEPGWERLIGIIVGMAILMPILLIWHALRPKQAERAADEVAVDKASDI